MAPVEVSLLFQRKIGVINIPTRSSQTDIKVENVKTEKSKSKITYSGTNLFNSLPTYLKEVENYSYATFKFKVKEFFLQINEEVDHLEDLSCNDCKHFVRCNCKIVR